MQSELKRDYDNQIRELNNLNKKVMENHNKVSQFHDSSIKSVIDEKHAVLAGAHTPRWPRWPGVVVRACASRSRSRARARAASCVGRTTSWQREWREPPAHVLRVLPGLHLRSVLRLVAEEWEGAAEGLPHALGGLVRPPRQADRPRLYTTSSAVMRKTSVHLRLARLRRLRHLRPPVHLRLA